MDDNLLVHQAKNGSCEAFSALMELYQGKVYNLALRMTGSAEDAADLCQETFINAWKGLSIPAIIAIPAPSADNPNTNPSFVMFPIIKPSCFILFFLSFSFFFYYIIWYLVSNKYHC